MNKTSTASFEAIQTAIKTLSDKGIKPTQRNVSAESCLSIRTVKTYWARVQGYNDIHIDRVQVSTDRVLSSNDATPIRVQGSSTPSAFERLKRRKPVEEVLPYKPWLIS